MSDQKHPFTLILSSAELVWLAGSFGITRLALPVGLPIASTDQLRIGQEKLIKSGLISKDPGTGWKVDQLAAFLVQSLGSVESYIRVEVHQQDGKHRQYGLYFLPGMILLVGYIPGQLECLFLPDKKALEAELIQQFNLRDEKLGKSTYLLPQPLELIRVAWRDLASAQRVLQRHQMDNVEINLALTWMKSIKTVFLIDRVSFSPHSSQSLFLCSNGSLLWIGKAEQNKVLTCFNNCSIQQACQHIMETL